MTGAHEQAAHDGTAQQGTTTTSGPAPGWYTDPGAPHQLRYFDGGAWTTHVASRPGPASVAAAPAYGDGATWATMPPAAATQSRFSVVRVLIAVAVVLVALGAISGGLRGVAKGRADAVRAPGPALALSNVAPETVVGRTPSTGAEAESNRSTVRDQLQSVMRTIPGSGPATVEIYGPAPTTAPERGLGIVMVAWTASSTPFDQDEFAAGFADGAVRASGGRATTTAAPDGGVVLCTESVEQVGPTTLCVWIRSGTGLVMMSEYDVPADTVRADLAGVVAQMARP